MNPKDKICVDVPLFIRLLEYAREDAKTDMDLHNVAENIIELSQLGETLGMQEYALIVSGGELSEGFDLRKYLAENKLLNENEPNFEDIEIGDKFVERDNEDEVFTVVDVFVPEFTIDIESITLKDSDGIQTTYPDDFDDGEFFDWFKPLK
jgi:hypothetical protein